MARSKISGLVTHTVDLGPPNYGRSLTITSTGTIAPSQQGANGIYGHAGLRHASIHNDGQVMGASGNGAANGGIGIDMNSALALTNAGTISGGAAGYATGGGTYHGGDGVDLLAGGTVTNAGLIGGGAGGNMFDSATTGGTGGIGLNLAAAGTINNSGHITGGSGGYGYDTGGTGGAGVALSAAGTLTNAGTISGGSDGQSGFSHQAGAGGIGVLLLAGGTLNNTTGTIIGGNGQYEAGPGGTGVQMAGGTMMNGGTITGGQGGFSYFTPNGTGGTGVDLSAGATLTNTGEIAGGAAFDDNHFYGAYGGTGVTVQDATLVDAGRIDGGHGGSASEGYGGGGGAGVILDGGTLIVSGTVAGGSPGNSYGGFSPSAGDAVQFGTLSGTLVIDPGAILQGLVVGDAGANDMLVLASGASAGTLTGLGSNYTGLATVTVDAGGSWTLAGATTLDGTTTLSDSGTLALAGAVSGSGTIDIASGGTLLVASALGGVAMDFAANATLQLGTQSSLTSTLSGFGSGDVIDLQHVAANRLKFAAGTLTVLQGSLTVARIDLAGSYTTANFTLGSDNNGGTDISFVPSGAASHLGGAGGSFEHDIAQAASRDYSNGNWQNDKIGQLLHLMWPIAHP